ncbi:5-oxoprolinase subunit PxpA [Radiobacillus deserti]|nr:5-oxoprolinase subunit PxpA [Radiobacillus deserti]
MNIDLNCDLGEGFTTYEKEIMPYISSANIACGFHAGDPGVMYETVKLAKKHQIKVGAHPGFPDKEGFGRRPLNWTADQVYQSILYQIGALEAIAIAQEVPLHHVKPHGALYHYGSQNPDIAEAIVSAILDINPALILYAPPQSEFIQAGEKRRLTVYKEGFADRTYLDNGSLTPRTEENALLTESTMAIKQCIQMINENSITTKNGKLIPIEVDTICVHGDSPHAVHFVKELSSALQDHGIQIGY